MRRETVALPGESADPNAGYPRRVQRRTPDCGAEEKKGEEATGQRTADGHEGGTQTDLRRGLDLYRRHQCNDGIHGDLGNRYGYESLSGRGPPHFVDGLGPKQRHQQRKNCGAGQKESEDTALPSYCARRPPRCWRATPIWELAIAICAGNYQRSKPQSKRWPAILRC